ncbi:DUF6303 family protein [Streptomyces sp. NPDC056632]|uniref:DUF6303 family protein n=1 Tax=Streptomyces sp. NPDC056632 TaxID=3345884 RepID=UPI0036825D95
MSGYYAALKWSAEDGGSWMLHIARPGLEELSPVVARWPGRVWPPPSLLDRYDALEQLGFAVVEGGAEAWHWRESIDPDGEFFLHAATEVRPLVREDVPGD